MKHVFSFVYAMLSVFVYSGTVHAARYSLSLDGGYLYTRWEYQSPTSTFSLLSKAGTLGRGEATFGGDRWELVAGGSISQFSFTAPTSRVITEPKISTFGFTGGARLKTPYIWTTLSYQGKQAVYLIESSVTEFEVKKEMQGFGVLALTLFGWGQGYKITLNGEIGVPAGSTTLDPGELKFGYFTQGTARVEFGSNFRVGIMVGIENQEYTIAESTKYYRSDFFGGLTIAIGAGKGGGRSGGGSRGSGPIPNWPL